jgi:hypothetical protein
MAAHAQREISGGGDDRQLMRRHRDGDPRARAILIERYLPLARSLALRYHHGAEPLDDLVQVASVGLIKAVDRWDPGAGSRSRPTRDMLLMVRYGLPATLIVAGFVLLVTFNGPRRWDGWAMCVGAGLSVLLLNWLFRLGMEGEKDRDEEAAARDYPH